VTSTIRSAAALLQWYVAHGAFDGVAVVDCDLAGLDLAHATFRGVTFERVSLDGANLQGCSFHDATLRAVSLRGATLDDTAWLGVDFGGESAPLSALDARGARLRFHGCVLDHARWARAVLDDVAFAECSLRGCDWRESRVAGLE